MVELNLKNIYKKYPNSEHYSVEDFKLWTSKTKKFIVFVGPSGCVGKERSFGIPWRCHGLLELRH